MIDWIESKGRGGHSLKTNYITISIHKNGSGVLGKDVNAFVLRFSNEAQKDLRLIYGDRLIIGFDRVSKQVCFKRTSDAKGYKLTKNKNGSKAFGTLYVQMSIDALRVPPIAISKQDVITESTHIALNAIDFFKKSLEAA